MEGNLLVDPRQPYLADPRHGDETGVVRIHAGTADGVVRPAGEGVDPRRSEGLRHELSPDGSGLVVKLLPGGNPSCSA